MRIKITQYYTSIYADKKGKIVKQQLIYMINTLLTFRMQEKTPVEFQSIILISSVGTVENARIFRSQGLKDCTLYRQAVKSKAFNPLLLKELALSHTPSSVPIFCYQDVQVQVINCEN